MAYDLEKATLEGLPIVRWAVLFQTPVGLFENLEKANERLTELDLDPILNIRPVSAIFNETGYYEVVP